jgi:ABC-type nitrate/sulfonate/bicarbonate transport system substrate-binding protein
MHTRSPSFARWMRLLAVFSTLLLMISACGGADETGEGESATGGAGGETQGDDGFIDFVFAPDALWLWMDDQGIRQEMEEEAGIQVLSTSTWDEFGVFAGGHADVISAASYEVPELSEATGEPVAIFGKYNSDRSVFAVPSDSDAQDICDLQGQRVASLSAVSITIMWGIYAQEFCDLDLSADGTDYELVVTDIQNMATLVERGDAESCLCLPDFSVQALRNGTIKPLYEGRSAAEIFADEFGNGHDGPQTNVFAAKQSWVEQNPKEAAFMLALWERALQEWRTNRDAIIDAYPEQFGVQSPEDAQFIKDWLDNTYDWYEDTVYIDDQWIEGETQIFDLMKETGYIEEGTENPVFIPIAPEESASAPAGAPSAAASAPAAAPSAAPSAPAAAASE